MSEKVAYFIASMHLSPEIATALMGALPILELRGSIPFSTFILNMSWSDALIWSLLGNLLPVPFILLLLDPAQKLLSRWQPMGRFFEWLFARTRRRGKVVEKYRALGLMLFVSIPLPVTGAWTGSVAAYIFGVRFAPSLIAIASGVTIAGFIITLACQGMLGFWDMSHKF